MSYSLRNYRHRNPKAGDEQKTNSGPFFQTGKGAAVQRKKKSGFFVQRLATSKEDEKLGTNDARMEKDKEEPMKPVQTKQAPGDKKKKKKPVQKKGHNMDKRKKKHIRRAEDPEKKKKKAPGGGGMIHKKEKTHEAEGHSSMHAVEAELEHQSGKGSALPAKTLAEMNHSFGTDFSHVRVHHDATAAALCNELNAQAFTHGCDIYFNEGKYNPESEEGKRLLAHELTHVIQQTS
ncbi:MAG TPA: DUF4157 domain-containing protein [Puia sp.]|jgi:hypothetical protein|nr:DUF4157 domain-containing protein [Puia sp.]